MARILIVEDEPDIALGLKLDLGDEGHVVEICADGAEATRLVVDPCWELILLDVMLPHRDGLEVCRHLRRSGLRTPVLMLTAKTQDAEKVLGLDMGADDYVTKPFSPRELRARVRALLRRSAPGEPDIQRVGDAEVDFSRAEVRRGNTRIDLTALELKLIRAFSRQPGRVLQRAQLVNEVWGHGVFVTDRVVDTHIVKVRRKLEPDPAQPRFIVSVRGLGYRFDP